VDWIRRIRHRTRTSRHGKLVAATFVTMDGVMQAPRRAGRAHRGRFAYGGWLVPHFDEDMGAQIDEWFRPAQDFLLGRTTYEIFHASWPKRRDEPNSVSVALNDKTKHVASRTLTSAD
jgi:dihydrofolate reductase